MKTHDKRAPLPRRKKLSIVCAAVALLVLVVWLNNTSIWIGHGAGRKLLAHRGVAQTFDISTVESDTNTAEIIYPPEHEYLENTIDSMRRAFDFGADCVEFDLHRTKDDQLAVFHDYLVDYRTDGRGQVSDFTMDELRQLDVGYGYTADGGQTYPFRGKGIGMMPEFHDVLDAFPDRELLIHLKDGGTEIAELVWQAIMGFDPERLALLSFYGSDDSMEYLQQKSSALRAMSMSTLKTALIQYELLGWTGYVPTAIRHAQIHLPESYAPYLWGWPARFMQRMDSVDTHVVLVAGDGGWSEGFDDEDSLSRVPGGFTGYVWTNRIDRIGGIK